MLHSFIYNVIPRPPDGSMEYKKHYNYCMIAVLILWLIYSAVQLELNLNSNYYQMLELWPSASSKDIKSKYRQFSLAFHPVNA
jgi:preprotein translocase subunit Sec63